MWNWIHTSSILTIHVFLTIKKQFNQYFVIAINILSRYGLMIPENCDKLWVAHTTKSHRFYHILHCYFIMDSCENFLKWVSVRQSNVGEITMRMLSSGCWCQHFKMHAISYPHAFSLSLSSSLSLSIHYTRVHKRTHNFPLCPNVSTHYILELETMKNSS